MADDYDFQKPLSSKNLINELARFQNMSKKLIVDQVKGPYYTIQSAIEAAVPNTLIKIEPGLYKENLYINVPNLFFEPIKENGNVYIVATDGPSIIVNIPKNQNVYIQGINISNKWDTKSKKRRYDDNITPITQFHNQLHSQIDILNKTENTIETENLILLKKGSLFISKCNLSLNLLYKTSTDYIAAIYMLKRTKCVVNNCEFVGSSIHLTNAISVNNADLSIRNSIIRNHRGMGILLKLSSKNTCSIFMCKILDNQVGIFCVGENHKSKATECKIYNNEMGIFLGLGSEFLVYRSSITNNGNGIYISNADPIIEENKIELNTKNGVKVASTQEVLSKPKITDNIIAYNLKCGVKCKGENNTTLIKYNNILKNKENGVLSVEKAHLSIFNNTIAENMGSGIIIADTASAFVEKNDILANLKANIAVGGSSSNDTVILNNKIFNGRCEGIFMFQAYKIRLHKNKITHNYIGALSLNSSPICFNNEILDNKSHGFVSIKKSNIVMEKNAFQGNKGVGLFMRDYFSLILKRNSLKDNKINLLVEKKNYKKLDVIADNNVPNKIQHPKYSICQIF